MDIFQSFTGFRLVCVCVCGGGRGEEGGTMGGIPSHYLQIYKIPQIKCRPFLEFPAPFSLR